MATQPTSGKTYGVSGLKKLGYDMKGTSQISYGLPEGWEVVPGSTDPSNIRRIGESGVGAGNGGTGAGIGGGGSIATGSGSSSPSMDALTGASEGANGSDASGSEVLNAPSKFRQGIGTRMLPQDSLALASLRKIY